MRGTGMILAASLVIVLAASTAPAAWGQTDIGLRAIEGRIGYTDLEGDAGGTFIISAAADMGKLTKDFGLELNADFWTKKWDAGSIAEWTWTNIAFQGNLRYGIPMTNSSLHPFVFGGLGLSYWNSDWSCPACGPYYVDTGESGVEFGFDFGAGADFGNGEGMTPTARLGYNVNGGADYLFISGGLKFPVGQ